MKYIKLIVAATVVYIFGKAVGYNDMLKMLKWFDNRDERTYVYTEDDAYEPRDDGWYC